MSLSDLLASVASGEPHRLLSPVLQNPDTLMFEKQTENDLLSYGAWVLAQLSSSTLFAAEQELSVLLGNRHHNDCSVLRCIIRVTQPLNLPPARKETRHEDIVMANLGIPDECIIYTSGTTFSHMYISTEHRDCAINHPGYYIPSEPTTSHPGYCAPSEPKDSNPGHCVQSVQKASHPGYCVPSEPTTSHPGYCAPSEPKDSNPGHCVQSFQRMHIKAWVVIADLNLLYVELMHLDHLLVTICKLTFVFGLATPCFISRGVGGHRPRHLVRRVADMGTHGAAFICLWIAAVSGFGCANPMGTEFITTFMKNGFTTMSQQRYELRVTSHQENTNIRFLVPGSNFDRNITINAGRTVSVMLPASVEISGTSIFKNTVYVKSNKPINMISLNHRFRSAEATVVYPLTSLGTDYILLTPKNGPSGSYKVFSVLASKEGTSVEIQLKGAVQFQGRTYGASSILTHNLAPFEGMQLLSTDNLSGSRVTSQKPVAVLSGNTCAMRRNQCNLVFEQLLPVNRWGKNFYVVPFSFQSVSDFVYVIAAGVTDLKYAVGDNKRNLNMVAGQVTEIQIAKAALSISSSAAVQVMFFSTGGRAKRYEYNPMLMNILDTASYCSSYFIYGQRDIDNYAIIIAKNVTVKGITFDGRPLRNPQWNEIKGTEYLWVEYYFQNSYTSHTVAHPTEPFGLQSVGIGTQYSYGLPGSCIKAPEPPAPSCSDTICPPRQVCVMENSRPKCVRQQVDVCWATGDPHYCTFDRHCYDFMGTCSYILAQTCGDVGANLPHFTILTKNENRGNVRVSWVGQVTLIADNYIIDVRKGEVGYVRVNNSRSLLPVILSNGTLRLFQSGNSVLMQFGNDMQVSYDWNHVVRVELTRRYAKNVCGMCGNYNQNPKDDLQTPSGSQAINVIAFGRSWKVGNDSTCWDDCRGPCLSCPPTKAAKFRSDDYCGLIGKTDNGPFSQCHSVIDPKIDMDNCVYDVCLNDGYRQISCQALKTYADACQRAGMNISQWRETAGCPFVCPPNTIYKLCGNACPPTCEDPEASSPCYDQCVETCECQPGFVLIEGMCQKRENCGCFHEGRSYAPNETFWEGNSCSRKCVCNGRSQKVECRETSCRAGEECTIKNGLRDCYPTTYGMCSASGDPRYITLDGRRFDFMGTCKYQFLALSNHNRGLTDFQISVMNDNRGNIKVSYTAVVYVHAYNTEIEISRWQRNKVKVNGLLKNLPYTVLEGKLTIYRSCSSAVVITDFGLTVTYDWSSILTAKIPSTYAGAVSGLCGNFNKDPKDDLTPKGETSEASPIIFGKSWKVGGGHRCGEVEEPTCDRLEEKEKRQREEGKECGVLLARQGPFRDCHALVDPEGFFKGCAYDSCILQQRQTIYCSVLAAYTMACQAAGGTVHPWRSHDFCPSTCSPHSHYEVCASSCPVTCDGLSAPSGCNPSCSEGCACDDEYVLSGGDCVPISQCGCAYNGNYYTVEETIYVGETCGQKCTCSPGGNMICLPASCSANEECRVENGVLGCYPNSVAICTANGDTHYITLDGRIYDFQGLCSYVLAQSCETGGNKTKLASFRVITRHEKDGSSATAIRLLTVQVYGLNLTLIQNRKGIVQVNGIDYRLPVTLLSGKIRAECYGRGTLIVADFGMMVRYDLVYHATVSVPSTYKGRMCGLCGNYNGDASDDAGGTASEIGAFAEKWKIPDGQESCTGCGGKDNPCLDCQGPKSEVFSRDNYCGILSSPTGPFAKCHPRVDPTPYKQACMSDLCQANGEGKILCNNVAAYAAACKEAGITDILWRSEDFCGMECVPHSHYSPCVDLCSTSCASLTDPYQCPEICAEGCQCDDGYIFDGTNCIAVEQCGCYSDGQYYKPYETVLSEDCSRSCTCNPNSGLYCQNATCAEDERCQILDGVVACINIDPCKSKSCRLKEKCELQDGKAVCVPEYTGICWAWGDPHFNTPDGYAFDFQGTCTYVLAKYAGNESGLVPFQVEAKNDNRGSQAVSFVKLVNIWVLDIKITIQTGEFSKIQVNDELTNLPVTLANGRISVTRSGFTAIVQLDFGLIITYDWNWLVEVTIPSSYYNLLSGLCGNFNQDPSDDQRAPNGTQINSIVEWAGLWRVYDRDPFCWDFCPGQCPTCEESKKSQYSGENSCGLLLKENDGPFRQCTSQINPNNFFDNCLYDVCMYDGAQTVLCKALEAYATTCMKQGFKMYDWRTPSGCREYNSCLLIGQITVKDKKSLKAERERKET
ncbi:IgGFc-binding protein-like [Pelodytes ibericus]